MASFCANPQAPEYDFWDFVTCNICHLPFVPGGNGPPSIPFWITECGHVICNNHLNPDQSCSCCGEPNIQLMALQREMDPPMSDWFRSVPHSLDSIATAAKFQQEALASLVRKYRVQASQLSSTCDRLRAERNALRKSRPIPLNTAIPSHHSFYREVDHLRRDNAQLRQFSGYNPERTQEPSVHTNHNGKRPMTETRRQTASVKTSSSPRSVATPVAPNRLTVPLGEHPNFSRQDHEQQPPDASSHSQPNADRPGTSRFTQQYAYTSQQSARMQTPQLSHEQAGPLRYLQGQPSEQTQRPPMTHPSLPSNPRGRFKPAGNQPSHPLAGPRTTNAPGQPTAPSFAGQTQQGQRSMGPPPTPQQRPIPSVPQTPNSHSGKKQFSFPQGSGQATGDRTSGLSSNRFVPPAAVGRSVASSSRALAGGAANVNGGGQRIPFMPGNFG
ncbi:hypothetical protein BV22DRAFT_1056312 [Leucogyrophana mollusca]|uniref:Uncharacterized protein n=1 Tax=Leucogyrophana mollusca TaxID=85980 RepID=A0ACB8BX77_9AGAM|nr:hypothetical protein BV22DRAFT_1056312 [Leucogyrophana mollusca]